MGIIHIQQKSWSPLTIKAAVLFLLVPLCNGAYGQERGPIAGVPPSHSLILEMREQLAAEGWTPNQIDDLLLGSDRLITYESAQIRAAFPEIADRSVEAYECSISTTSPASYAWAFVPEASTGSDVVVHEVGCRHSDRGLYCSLSTADAVAMHNPREFFFLGDDVQRKKGIAIVEKYYRDTVERLPEAFAGLRVNEIEKSGSHYVLTLGRNGCACRGRVELSVLSFLGIIVSYRLVGDAELSCI